MVSVWACFFRNMKYTNRPYRDYLSGLVGRLGAGWTTPLLPRDAFYGGRTNASCLYAMCRLGEKIKYVDFTSLYPYINKYGTYPVGHPHIITDPSLDALIQGEYFGMAKCRVVPPRGLFHPVLPVRLCGKLMFPLCRACVVEKDTKDTILCTHEDDDDRAFDGTWCTPELMEAQAQGYAITRVAEVHHFERVRTGLFADYVNTFLQSKQEASGWPQV